MIKDNMPLISVIVPVYNIENCIGGCIDSILKQTYNNLEIILVDDGSKDSSGSICDKYAQNYSRIKVIHKHNGGLSDARNCGIDNSSGEYIGFVDGDDWIANDMFEILLSNIKEYDVDIACIGMFREYTKKKYSPDCGEHKVIRYTKDEALKAFLSGTNIENEVCRKLFKRSTIAGIRFQNLACVEDECFTFEALLRCTGVSVNPARKYIYVQYASSLIHNINSEQALSCFLEKNIMEYCIKSMPDLSDYGKDMYYRGLRNSVANMIRQKIKSDKIRIDIIKELKKTDFFKTDYWRCKSLFDKTDMFLLRHFYVLFKYKIMFEMIARIIIKGKTISK